MALFLWLHSSWQALNWDTGFLRASSWHRRAWGVNPPGNGRPGDQDPCMKISGNFINNDPLKMPNFYPLWHAPPPLVVFLLSIVGSLDTDPVYSTLCPSITSTCSTSKVHLNMFRYSVGGDVTLDAITCGQDCRSAYERGAETRNDVTGELSHSSNC